MQGLVMILREGGKNAGGRYLLSGSNGMTQELPRDNDTEDISAKKDRGRVFYRDCIVLGLLVLVHFVFVYVVYAQICHEHNTSSYVKYLSMVDVGVLMSQPLLLAFWAALVQQHFVRRFLWCYFLCTLLFFAEEISTGAKGNLSAAYDPFVMLILQFGLFLLSIVILSIVKIFSGWQVQMARTAGTASNYQAAQFGIKHILIFITITAFFLGLLRMAILQIPLPPSEYYAEVCNGIFTTLLLDYVTLLPVVFMPWCFLADRAKMLVGASLLMNFIVIIDLSLEGAGDIAPENFSLVLYSQLGAALSVLFTTLPLRLCGYRMVRVKKENLAA
jgi:hypothetical protein